MTNPKENVVTVRNEVEAYSELKVCSFIEK
jgi:hypothetical protein